MNRRAVAAASLIAALSLSGLAVGASAQEPADEADPSATSKTATGVVTLDEDTYTYYLDPADGGDLIELSYGPSWFWGAASPLHAYYLSGVEVTVVGQVRDGGPNDNASKVAQEQAADKTPAMRVRSIVGPELRAQGKPPWAGGPKNEELGEVHPGFEGWSEGQAEKAADAEARAAEKATKAAERAEAKATKAAERAEAKAERAEAKAAKAAERAARAEEKGNQP